MQRNAELLSDTLWDDWDEAEWQGRDLSSDTSMMVVLCTLCYNVATQNVTM